jgi:hypothetical protein
MESHDNSEKWARLIHMGGTIAPITLTAEKSCIGSGPSCNVRLENDGIESKHCTIKNTGEFRAQIESHVDGKIVVGERVLKKDQSVPLTNGEMVILDKNGLGMSTGTLTFIFTLILDKLKQPRPSYDLHTPGKTVPLAAEGSENRKSQSTPQSAEIAGELKCGICLELAHRCVSLMPCLHHFCGGCISPWLDKKECPNCKQKITRAKRNPHINSLIEAVLKLDPSQARDESELALLDSKDRFMGQNEIDLTPTVGEDVSEEDADPVDDSRPCPECSAPRLEDGFRCLPDGLHAQCTSCRRYFPNRATTHPQKCILCDMFYCNLYLPNCRGDIRLMRLKDFKAPARLEPHMLRDCDADFQVREQFIRPWWPSWLRKGHLHKEYLNTYLRNI